GAEGRCALRGAPGSYRLFLVPGEAGIRDQTVTGVQASALPILSASRVQDLTVPFVTLTVKVVDSAGLPVANAAVQASQSGGLNEIGRASCRERVGNGVVGGAAMDRAGQEGLIALAASV